MGAEDARATVSASIELELDPEEAFAIVTDELSAALAARGIALELQAGGSAREANVEIGRVTGWEPGQEVVLEWRAASWEPEAATEVVITFEPTASVTRIRVEQRGWGALLGGWDELA